ncbi:MAG TPA: hypothetical protein ENI66_02100 [Candidatus Yonathbacteria bacterium]|nr:hypothetical protein [Candidatus Yonathbacteria bacterium]
MDMYNEKSMTKIIQEFNSRYPKEGGEGYTKDDIRRMQDDYKTSYFVSLDQPLHDDEEFAMIDTIANINTRNPQSIAGDMSAHKKIGEFICQLNEDEEFVMVKLFGLDGKGANTYKEIGAQLNLLVRDVKKIESSALKSLLRTMFSSRILEEI